MAMKFTTRDMKGVVVDELIDVADGCDIQSHEEAHMEKERLPFHNVTDIQGICRRDSIFLNRKAGKGVRMNSDTKTDILFCSSKRFSCHGRSKSRRLNAGTKCGPSVATARDIGFSRSLHTSDVTFTSRDVCSQVHDDMANGTKSLALRACACDLGGLDLTSPSRQSACKDGFSGRNYFGESVSTRKSTQISLGTQHEGFWAFDGRESLPFCGKNASEIAVAPVSPNGFARYIKQQSNHINGSSSCRISAEKIGVCSESLPQPKLIERSMQPTMPSKRLVNNGCISPQNIAHMNQDSDKGNKQNPNGTHRGKDVSRNVVTKLHGSGPQEVGKNKRKELMIDDIGNDVSIAPKKHRSWRCLPSFYLHTRMLNIAHRKKYYVVFEGREQGIYDSWEECHPQVHQYKGALHKSYNNFADACKHLNHYLAKKDFLTA